MLPKETRLALFPARSHVCRLGPFRRLELRVPTLADAAVMECLGVELLSGTLPDGEALVAAWVLSITPERAAKAANGDVRGARRFVKRLARHIPAVSSIVNAMVEDAFLPFVPPKAEENGWKVDDGLPDGYGWPLEMAEALCGLYGWTFDYAMAMPLQRAVAMMSVARSRKGAAAGGPDYYNRIRLERMRRAGLFDPVEKAAKE